MNVRQQLERFEGRRCEAYPDPLTRGDPWTIGVGHCGPEVKRGIIWTEQQVNEQLSRDIEHCVRQCQATFPWFEALNEPRQAVLIGMCFQMGLTGLLRFKDALAAVRDQRWETAAEHMRRSLWAAQTPTRAHTMAYQMATGEWQ